MPWWIGFGSVSLSVPRFVRAGWDALLGTTHHLGIGADHPELDAWRRAGASCSRTSACDPVLPVASSVGALPHASRSSSSRQWVSVAMTLHRREPVGPYRPARCWRRP